MNKLFANNIFTDPEGWTQKAVGSTWRYRLMQIMTVISGLCLFVFFEVASEKHDWPTTFSVAVCIFGFAVDFPLMYLRALRHMHLKDHSREGNQQTSPGDSSTRSASLGTPKK
jgi:hypothetical protein